MNEEEENSLEFALYWRSKERLNIFFRETNDYLKTDKLKEETDFAKTLSILNFLVKIFEKNANNYASIITSLKGKCRHDDDAHEILIEAIGLKGVLEYEMHARQNPKTKIENSSASREREKIRDESSEKDLWFTCLELAEKNFTYGDVIEESDKFLNVEAFVIGLPGSAKHKLPLNELGYDCLKNWLQKRYAKLKVLKDSYLWTLMNLDFVNETAEDLKDFSTEISDLARRLISIGGKAENLLSIVKIVIKEALQKTAYQDVYRKLEKLPGSITFDQFINSFEKEIKNKEKEDDDRPTKKNTRKKQADVTKNATKISQIHELDEFEDDEKSRKTQKETNASKNVEDAKSDKNQSSIIGKRSFNCTFCNGSHKSHHCPLDRNDRWESILKQNRCLVCLKCGHVARSCQVTRNCDLCENRHHTWICNRTQESSETCKDSADNKIRETDESYSKFGPDPPDCCVALMLVNVFIEDECGNKKIARAAFSPHSNETVVSKYFCEQLDFPSARPQTIELTPIIGESRQIQSRCLRISLLHSKTKKFVMKTTAYEINAIPQLPPLNLHDNFKRKLRKKNIELSDEMNTSKVDVLFGSKVYYSVGEDRLVRLSVGSAATKTSLGWCLIGKIPCDSSCSSDSNKNLVLTSFIKPLQDQSD